MVMTRQEFTDSVQLFQMTFKQLVAGYGHLEQEVDEKLTRL